MMTATKTAKCKIKKSANDFKCAIIHTLGDYHSNEETNMTAKNIIDLVGLGDTVGIKNAIEAAIQEKVAERLENLKIDLVNQTFNESSHEDDEDDDDDYKKSKKKKNPFAKDSDNDAEDDDDDLDESSQDDRRLKAKHAAERARLKAKERRETFRKKETDIKNKEKENEKKVEEGQYSSKKSR